MSKNPVVISTWKYGLVANKIASEILNCMGDSLDAVEEGIRIIEEDPKVTSVGFGGYPDRDGFVTLDAGIMDEKGNCGSVVFLQNIRHPISVARLVMEKSPHSILAGEGALRFALANGFKKENLLTAEAKKEWLRWIKKSKYKSKPKLKENHDTVAVIALDKNGNLAVGCSTSGLSWKYHGRVGDSPIIGAGLFVDNEIGAAAATGEGEIILKVVGSHLVVESMRAGQSPQKACELAVKRIAARQKNFKNFQVAFIAVNKKGETGAFALQKGFQYALYKNGVKRLINSGYLLNK